MPELGRELLRKLADWKTEGLPVSSLYLDVDGHRYPRRHEYVQRAQQLCDRLRGSARSLGHGPCGSVGADAGRMLAFLDGELERGAVRGVALFACSGAGLWEEVLTARPLRDRATVSDQPYLLPLDALVERYESFCTVLVDRARARLFLAEFGRMQELTTVFDEVPGRHEQGGRSQSRMHRHIEDHVGRHLRHVADVLLRFHKRRRFDHLILAGPDELLPEFDRVLHDYLRRRVAATVSFPMSATAAEVSEMSLAVEERLETQRERGTLDRLRAGRQAVMGLEPVLGALNEGRVDTLVVPFGVAAPGFRCGGCGRLAVSDGACATCGSTMHAVPDVVEDAAAAALRQRSRVEAIQNLRDEAGGEVGALLRF